MRTGAVNISAIYSPQMLPFAISALPSNAAKLPDSLVFSNLVHLSLEQLQCVRSKYILSVCTLQSAFICVWCSVSLVYWTRLTILPTFATIIWPFNVCFFHLPVSLSVRAREKPRMARVGVEAAGWQAARETARGEPE